MTSLQALGELQLREQLPSASFSHSPRHISPTLLIYRGYALRRARRASHRHVSNTHACITSQTPCAPAQRRAAPNVGFSVISHMAHARQWLWILEDTGIPCMGEHFGVRRDGNRPFFCQAE